MFSHRRIIRAPIQALLFTVGLAAGWAAYAPAAGAQDLRFLRIGTGSISGVYFPVGGLIANAVSNPPGSRACDAGGSCGVPGLIAVAQATLGSVANVEAIASGRLETALVQSDIAHGAYTASLDFAGDTPLKNLRALASLYPEALHVVVRRDSKIRTIPDLRGRRVSLDLSGSGTRAMALAVLKSHGVDPRKLKQVNSQIGPAADRIRTGRIDAFFFVGGFPVSSLSRLARDVRLRLIDIEGAPAEKLRADNPFLSVATIPAGTYRSVGRTPTVAVRALWLASAELSAETAHGLVRALWHPSTRRLFDHGVAAAGQINREGALTGITVPLHPGAERYYRESGLLEGAQKSPH